MANRKFLYVNSDLNYEMEAESITISTGASDSGKLATLGTDGKFDASLIPDAIINQRDYKDSCRVASEVNVNLASPGASIDGVTMANGERVLLAGQTTASENGIYVFNGASVAMTRATDADEDVEVTAGMMAIIEEGTRADQFALLVTNNPIVVDTTALTFAFQSASSLVGGAGIDISTGTVSAVLVADGGLEFDVAGNGGKIQVKFADTSVAADLDGTNGLHAISAQDLSSNSANQGANILGADPTNISQSSQPTIQGILEDMSSVLDTAAGSIVMTSGEALSEGDLVYISGNDEVSKQVTTGPLKRKWPVGVAKSTVASGASVEILANDKILAGVLTGLTPTAGQRVFWDGSALTLSQSFSAGQSMIQVGIAKNANDLWVDVKPIAVNF